MLKIDKEYKAIEQVNENFIESSKILELEYKEKQDYLTKIKEVSNYFDKRNIDNYKSKVYKKVTNELLKESKIIIDLLASFFIGKFDQYLKEKQEREEKIKEKNEEGKPKRRK